VSKLHTMVRGFAARIPAEALAVGLFAVVSIGGVWLLTFESIRHDLGESQASEIKQHENLVLAHEEQMIRPFKEVDLSTPRLRHVGRA
jgi:hypothetical protein